MEISTINHAVIEKAIACYLDANEIFKPIIVSARRYESEQQNSTMPLRFTIEVNVLDLAKINVEAFNFLRREPQMFCKLMENVIHCAINSLDLEIDLSNIRVTLRIDLPSFPEYICSSTSHLLPGLFIMRGTLIAVTTISKYVRSKLYFCPVIGCPCGGSRERVDNECKISQQRCSVTNIPKNEDVNAEETGDESVGVLISQDAISNLHPGLYRGITVYFRDDLAAGLKLGGCYQLTVTKDRGMTSLLAWGVQELLAEPQSRLLSGLRLCQLPLSIQRLVHQLSKNCPNSSWALFAALSSQLAHQIAPINCFLHLKSGILLSLASQCTKQQQQPCHLMCLGVDGMPLVNHCAKLARRLVAPGSWPPHHPAGHYRIDEPTGSVWLEAGPLLLAAGGVCLLGDWHAYQKQRTSEIFHALENGEVYLDTQEFKRTTGSLPTRSLVHPVQSAIWAKCDYKYNGAKVAANKALRTVIDGFTTLSGHRQTPEGFIGGNIQRLEVIHLKIPRQKGESLAITPEKLFGMPFIGSCGSMEEIEDFTVFKLSETVVNSAFNSETNNLLIPEKDLREFLDIVSSKTVEISDSAQNLLQRYFVDTRRSRPGCLPAAAIKIMTALSEAHARISLRDEVIEDDALFVIFLYEEALTAIYGASILPRSNPSKRPDTSDPIGIAQQVHENMTDFALSMDLNLKSSTVDAESHSNWLEE